MKQDFCQNHPHIKSEQQNHQEDGQTTQSNEFSFLIDTENYDKNQYSQEKPSKNDKQDIDNFLNQLKQINENLTVRMNRMNQQIQLQIQKHEDKKIKQKIKSQLFQKGKRFYNSKGLIGISCANQDLFSVQKHLIQNKSVQTPSNFQIDQNQNFIKMNSQIIQKENIFIKIPKISLPTIVLQKSVKQKLSVPNLYVQANNKKNERRRIYESVLSKFSTASLIAMNKNE